VDEFLPEVNESNLFVLQRASDQAIINPTAGEEEEKSDEIPADLLIPDSIPEIDEHSDSSDDELVLKPPVATLTPKAAEMNSNLVISSLRYHHHHQMMIVYRKV
ncbi:uncharacterized protein LOC119658116, partial [Hermetia illucens]|uniref:uncharacterized protein LOC119658116 n=1 Tax=Hermetia illucens TaxID=343691 RepID=UPI0018CC71EA